jgi:hypothetical protein
MIILIAAKSQMYDFVVHLLTQLLYMDAADARHMSHCIIYSW